MDKVFQIKKNDLIRNKRSIGHIAHRNQFKSKCSFFCKTWNPLHQRMLWWNWPCGSGEEDLQISSMYFGYFLIISPLKGAWHFIWINLNPLYPRLLCAKLVEIGPVVLWKVYKRTDCMYFIYELCINVSHQQTPLKIVQ